MPGYVPPNPYGSYFNFGSPEMAASQSFMPGGGASFSSGTLAMMGAPVGGFNPTSAEYVQNRMRDAANQRFMSDILRADNRVGPMSSAIQQALFGGNERLRRQVISNIGGMSNFNEGVGFLLNMPGISGLMGGRATSLGIGAMGVATSGMSLNGYGMMGDGFFQSQAARAIFQHTQNRFYLPGGSANLASTQGLNRDQIGGIQLLGASQGAFAGMNMGNFSLSKAGAPQFQMDKGTLDKIGKFTEQAAKAISGLIDIYGNGPIGELAQKAQQITGLDLSKLSNVTTMVKRFADLRTTAIQTGMDTQTMFEMASGATRMGMALGQPMSVAGSAGQLAAIQGAYRFKLAQQDAGVFYMSNPTQQEMTSTVARDLTGMSRDPMGARRAAFQLLQQNGIKFGADLVSQVNNLGAGEMGKFDALMKPFGVNLSAMIRNFGGGPGIMNQLNAENKDAVNEVFSNYMGRRQDSLLHRLVRGTSGGSEAMYTILSGLSATSAVPFLTAAQSGDRTAMQKALMGDLAGRLDPGKFMAVGATFQGDTSAVSRYQTFRNAMAQMPMLQNYQRPIDIANLKNAPVANFGIYEDDIRGQFMGGFSQGIFDRLAGNDPKSKFAYLATFRPDMVAGIDPKHHFSFNYSQYHDAANRLDSKYFLNNIQNLQYEMNRMDMSSGTMKGANFMKALGLGIGVDYTGFSPAKLNEVANSMFNPQNLQTALAVGGFDLAASTGRGGMWHSLAEKNVDTRSLAGLAISTALQNSKMDFEMYAPFASMAESLRYGKMMRVGRDGKLIDLKHPLSNDEKEKLNYEIIHGSTRPQYLMNLKPEQLTTLGKQFPDWGQQAATVLKDMEDSIGASDANGTVGGYWEKKSIAERRMALEKAGKTAEDFAGGVQKIVGTLKILGDGTAELGGTIQQKR